jgi:hypothetical protein
MASEWSPAAGWRSYATWKRWYRQNWGGLQASPPPGEWRAVYRAFSEPEGIQAEVEIAVGDQTTAAVDETEVRRRARASLVRFQQLIAQDPHHHSGSVVVVQVVVDPTVGCRWAAARWARHRPRRDGRWVSWSSLRWRSWGPEQQQGIPEGSRSCCRTPISPVRRRLPRSR